MSFQQDKEKQLKMKDNSSIGCWDTKIRKLCKKLNSRKEYYTTSSCAGRIILIKNEEEKKSGLFVLRIHEKIKLAELKKILKKTKGDVDFRQEPCILHVACKDLVYARQLLQKAIFSGWKRSGIISAGKRFILELMSTEHIDAPIIRKSKLIVSPDYLKILVKEANSKLERTWSKIRKLESLL